MKFKMEELDVALTIIISPGNNPNPLDILAGLAGEDRNLSSGEEEDLAELMYRS